MNQKELRQRRMERNRFYKIRKAHPAPKKWKKLTYHVKGVKR